MVVTITLSTDYVLPQYQCVGLLIVFMVCSTQILDEAGIPAEMRL